MPAIQLFARADASAPPAGFNPIYIAGFVVVGVIVLGLSVWVGIRTYRKRVAENREDSRGAAFLSVRGVVREGEHDSDRQPFGNAQAAQSDAFSRDRMNPSIVLPDSYSEHPASSSREGILDYHRQSGTFPRPFAPKPFSFALSVPSGSRNSTMNSKSDRSSFISIASNYSRFSAISGSSSIDTAGTARKVRQLFTPVLPDELLITSLGEQLTVVQSFDDGWCIVGREGSIFASAAKSLFAKAPAPSESNVELGVVPAWCFLKPTKGVKTERPMRSSSLGVTVQMDAPGSSRASLMSWSNF